MKHLDDIRSSSEPLSVLSIRESLAAHGLTVTENQAAAIARHALMVLEANRKFNLTRINTPADVEMLHIVDSAAVVPAVSASPAGPVADLGSGPGYPGIVVAILTGRPTVLVESVKKKANFLDRVVAELGLGASVYADRAEELARDQAGAFACVVVRAVASLPSLVELAAPLLTVGGRLVAMKSRPADDEVASGIEAARLCGMAQVDVLQVTISATHLRTFVVYERVGASRVALPRRVGLAQSAPLA